ncbi:helix-turn-helix transcriptional regulator [Azospirillum sp. RWY-5-1]|uniref:Helix-turn-helix transcriptional regulator n=2 Tax=Azospirillum oleiclasticum TaxID=2735135 RepID=A0ABX2TM28_9PROT|nr:helix-turn-helix transcriptional regulator [Azospirillum oleiclasticum]NYZ24531.1 helix-turn-helix transcriptional regulator [Azospirillum oleiclasticum]
MKLTGRLLRRRGELGLSQLDLALTLGIGVATLQRHESGRAEPSAMHLFRWAAALGISITSHVIATSEGGAS